MSNTTNPITSQTSTHTESTSLLSVQLPSFLETAGKVTKVIAGIICGIAAIAIIGLGINLALFTLKICLGIALFAIAGRLIYTGFTSSTPNLNSRDIIALAGKL